ncbi:hypothetical protein [Flaviaesturariibacter terrae]
MQPVSTKKLRAARYLLGGNIFIFFFFLLAENCPELNRDGLTSAICSVLVPVSALILLATPVAAILLLVRSTGTVRQLAALALLVAAASFFMTVYLILRSGGC